MAQENQEEHKQNIYTIHTHSTKFLSNPNTKERNKVFEIVAKVKFLRSIVTNRRLYSQKENKKISWLLVRERTIPT
jgi:hypothetical protein